MSDFTITDYDGKPIEVGTRVRYYDYGPDHPDWGQDEQYQGTVESLGEFDVDDRHDHPQLAYPNITVRFDSGDRDTWPTSEWEFEGTAWERVPMRGKVEELVVLEPAS